MPVMQIRLIYSQTKMNLKEFITFCELRGDRVRITDHVSLCRARTPVIPCKQKALEVYTADRRRHAFVWYREGLDSVAIEKCTFYLHGYDGNKKHEDIPFDQLVRFYLK